jgi:hypothetical protein
VTGSGRPVWVFVVAAGLCWHSLSAEPGEAAEVAGKIGRADLHLCPGKADGAHEQHHAVLLCGKDMLDAGADPGAWGIGLRLLL